MTPWRALELLGIGLLGVLPGCAPPKPPRGLNGTSARAQDRILAPTLQGVLAPWLRGVASRCL